MRYFETILPYSIEIFDDNTFSSGSADNVIDYKNEIKTDDIGYTVFRHGIIVRDENSAEINSLILHGAYGKCGIQRKAYLIIDSNLLICEGKDIYSFTIPELRLDWKIQADEGLVFGIFKMNDDVIVHGEMSITRLALNGCVVWQHYSGDIFVADDESESFVISGDEIHVKDWSRNEFTIKYDGTIALVNNLNPYHTGRS